MKKLLPVLILGILLVGCDAAIKPTVEQKDDMTMTEKTEKVDQINPQEDGESEIAGRGTDCSEGNLPRIESAKFGDVLNLCGETTSYFAYEFPEQNLILYEWSKWNEEKQEHEYMIKTIETKAPFTKTDLIPKALGQGPVEEKGLYYWGMFADGPGVRRVVMVFDPVKKEMIAVDYQANVDGTKEMTFWNSEGKIFSFENEKVETCMMMPFDTLPASLSGRDANYQQEKRLALYGDVFPKMFPCVDGDGVDTQTGELQRPRGYFDFETGKFTKPAAY